MQKLSETKTTSATYHSFVSRKLKALSKLNFQETLKQLNAIPNQQCNVIEKGVRESIDIQNTRMEFGI